jgi:hypothetical protein
MKGEKWKGRYREVERKGGKEEEPLVGRAKI